MMVSRQELKRRAKLQLGGGIFTSRWLMALVVCLVQELLLSVGSIPGAITNGIQIFRSSGSIREALSGSGVVDASSVSISITPLSGLGTIVWLLLAGPITYGLSKMFLKQARDNQDMVFADLFSGFKEDFGGTFLINLMITIFAFLWSLLFVIPGIVKAYAYSQAYYIKADHPDYDWRACINESKRLMNGHKGELFVLDLSFIGWYIVGALCLGVGTLWVTPYYQAAHAHFYQTLAYAAPEAPTGWQPAE